MRCYADKYCKKVNTEECGELCRAYMFIEAVYEGSNIPKIYRYDKPLIPSKKDLDSFKLLKGFMDGIVQEVAEGNNLFIFSKGTGNGKTSWATKIVNNYIRKNLFKRVENLVYFINTPQLLEDMRLGYNDGQYELLISKIKEADIVIFDDIGAEKSTEWVRERLYTIINFRVSEGKTTIYTSNLSIDELALNLGQRVASRLMANTLSINLVGADKRGAE